MRGIMLLTLVLGVGLCAAVFALAADAPKAAEKATSTAAAPEKTAAPKAAPEKLSEEGFVPIFNGKDLTGWDGNLKLWSVKDGCIRGETTQETTFKGNNTFLIWRGNTAVPAGKVEDFELRLTCKLVGGNSGIQYRSTERPEKWVVMGYQMEVSTEPRMAGFLYGELFRGSLCMVDEKALWGKDGKKQVLGKIGNDDQSAKSYKKDDWNDYRIVARGNHIVQYLNGIQTIDLTDEDAKAIPSGIIALQIHAGYIMTVDFKDIRLKTFPKDASATPAPAKTEAKP
jgi:hypothetical protein